MGRRDWSRNAGIHKLTYKTQSDMKVKNKIRQKSVFIHKVVYIVSPDSILRPLWSINQLCRAISWTYRSDDSLAASLHLSPNQGVNSGEDKSHKCLLPALSSRACIALRSLLALSSSLASMAGPRALCSTPCSSLRLLTPWPPDKTLARAGGGAWPPVTLASSSSSRWWM